MKTEAISTYMEFLKCYKRPETMFHFIKIPFRKKGDWKYENVCKYIKQKVGVL